VGAAEGDSRGAEVVVRQRGVARRTVWISILTLVSRVLGLVREVISAGLFGDASVVYDAFLFAWRVPNLFRRFLGEGALSTALQSSLTEADARRGDEAGRELFVATLRLLSGLLVALCAVVMGAVTLLPDVMPGTGFAWLGPEPDVVRELTVRLAPFVLFVCLTAAVGGALNVRGHYSLPALGPVLLNVLWILGLIAIAAFLDGSGEAEPDAQLEMVRWLAWCVLLAGAAQLLLMSPALRRRGLSPTTGWLRRPSPAARRAARAVLERSAPLAFGAAVYQINVMVDGLMAQSLLAPGGQTVHYLANRVQQFPLALVAIAATTAVFPALAALGQERRLGELRRLHDLTQRNVLFVALPATVGLATLALPVTAALFQYGHFGELGVERTADTLRMLSFAILPAGAVGLVARTYYAVGDFKTPVRVSSLMLFVNAGLNVAFIRLFDMDADGLALATALTSFGNLLFLLPGLSRKHDLVSQESGFVSSVARMTAASAVCAAAAFACERGLDRWLPGVPRLTLAIAVGVVAYLAAARALRVPEWGPFADRIQRIRSRIGGK